MDVQKQYGKDTIFLNVNAMSNADFSSEYSNPLKEYRDMVSFTNFPIGWMIDSPFYNRFLKDHGFTDREHVVPEIIKRQNVVLCFWDSEKIPWSNFSKCFATHLNSRYSQMFKGKSIVLKTVLDNRHASEGWLFFRLVIE